MVGWEMEIGDLSSEISDFKFRIRDFRPKNMRVINIILATAGWIWLGVTALYFYKRLRRESAESRAAETTADRQP